MKTLSNLLHYIPYIKIQRIGTLKFAYNQQRFNSEYFNFQTVSFKKKYCIRIFQVFTWKILEVTPTKSIIILFQWVADLCYIF